MHATKTNVTTYSIRWLFLNDMPRVVEIEQQCFSKPWTFADFAKLLRKRTRIGMVVEVNRRIEGFMIYDLVSDDGISLDTIAVDPAYQSLYAGKALIHRLVSKMELSKRDWVSAYAADLYAQNFLRACGFTRPNNGEEQTRFSLFRLTRSQLTPLPPNVSVQIVDGLKR